MPQHVVKVGSKTILKTSDAWAALRRACETPGATIHTTRVRP